MSAPPRGPGGGTTGGRATPPHGPRGRGAGRGSTLSQPRGRGGRGRGAGSTMNARAEGLLQGLQAGSLNKRGESSGARAGRGERKQSLPRERVALCPRPSLGNQIVLSQKMQPPSTTACLPKKGRSSAPRGPSRSTRGRGAVARRANAPLVQTSSSTARANPSHKDFMAEMTNKFQDLKQRRETERAKAIRDGFLADPEKKTSLDNAITPVGTCTDMCPEFERVERIVQNMVEKTEKTLNEATGRDMPSEDKMVKRFRRSAAGNDEQLPSDIRTPVTLQTTLNYLVTSVIGGGERLSAVHKFVWDRTRAIRNDFSIQQVSKDEDVGLAIDCFEKIARFHILSLHQLSNPDNLNGEGFDAHQELEQLNNTLLSLMYYYDDNREKQRFPNEAEFRAYYIMFQLQTSHPDLEDRMQSWPPQLLDDKRVQTAFRLYSAATNTLFDQGPLKPTTPFSIAQGNSGTFWKLLKSKAVSYLMSCIAEIYFGQVRYLTLQNLWESHKGPVGQQNRNQEWTLDELTEALAFDTDEETLEFCQGFDLTFKTSDEGVYHLVFQSSSLDQSFTPRKQVFSHSIVEDKRYRRSLVAVIHGIGVARAIREGLVEADVQQDGEQPNAMEEDPGEELFFPENSVTPMSSRENNPASAFNPEASVFAPGATDQTPPTWPSSATSFGKPSAVAPLTPSTSTPNPSTGTAAPGSGVPSFPPASSASSSAGFGIGSTPFVDPFALQPQSTITSSPSTAPRSPPFKFPDFTFGQPTTSAPPPKSASFPFPFGKPSTVPSTFGQPSPLQRDKEQEQSSSPENSGDAPTFVPSLPGKSMPCVPSASPFEARQEVFPPSRPENKPLGGSPWPKSKPQQKENHEPAQDRLSLLQESLPPFSVPQGEPESVKDDSTPVQPPPSPRPSNLELSEDSAKQIPSFLPPNTGTGFRWEGPSSIPSPRNTDANTTRPPITAVFAPRPLPSFDSISRPSPKPSATINPPPHPLSWNSPAPSVEEASNSRTPLAPKPALPLPSQFPAPHVPSKGTKQGKPKTKELKAVSPNDPTPRAHSPLRERPVIFGDDANAFRQSAALVGNSPSSRTTVFAQDRDRAAETIARLAMLQPEGLMQEYLHFTLPDLLKPVMRQFEREKPILAAKAARHQILAKKYFKWWKTNTYRRVRNRQARDRRQRIDAFQQEGQRRMRADAELEAILRAKKETERIQAEMLARSTNELRDNVPDGAQQTAGQKRKSIHVDRAEDRVNGNAPRKIAKSHNRSRTMGHAEELFDSLSSTPSHISAATNAAQPLSLIYSGRPTLDGPGATKDLRRSLSGRKDTTRTDYFRLKALGIDPNTPIVPDTKSSLERKRQREEHDDIGATRTRARTLSSTTRPPVQQFSSPGAAASRTSGQNQSWTPPHAITQTATNSLATQVDDDDELLREARKVREAFSSGIEWFKTQAASIEKEVQEELRRSASQTSSRSSPRPSANGLSRSNGHEYLPGPGIAGRNLSRTEERIRRTGAHGLATKPIGGSGGYLAVAMSRDSAAKLNVDRQSQATPEVPHVIKKTRKGTKKMSEKDGRYVPQQSDEDSEDFEHDAEENGLEPHSERQSQSAPRVVGIVKKTRKGKRKMGERDGRYIPREDDEDDEDSEDSEELEGDVESNGLELHAESRTNGKPAAIEVDHHRSKTYEEPPEEYDDAQEDVDDVQESLEQGQYTEYDQFEGGDTEDLYEDGDDEEEQYDLDEEDGEGDGEGEEEEEEEADEVGALPNQHELKGQGQPVGGYWLRSSVTPERGLTPNGGGQMMSRASSGMGTGTGASVDDALVLDSD